MNSTTQLHKQAKMMKREFSTNWFIYRACLHSTPSNPDLKHDIKKKASAKEMSPQCNREFNKLVLEAVDEALSSLGESAKQAIYSYMMKTCKIKRSEIPSKIEDVTHALEQIFGDGARLIEIQIMKALYQKVGDAFVYSPKKDELTFVKYVEAARLSDKSSRSHAQGIRTPFLRHQKIP